MKILIYGAGAIGSTYAVRFANAGYDVSVFARGNRLQSLQDKGLLYIENNSVKKAVISVIGTLNPDDIFDYIFVTVRYEQVETALTELKNNNSRNIVTMVNTPKGYNSWVKIIAEEKLIPAFPGAGGWIENGVLFYRLTPKIIQPTTFGEISGALTDRVMALRKIFKTSNIPCSISKNMEAWQKCHLALVMPLANGIYFDGGDNYTTAKNKKALRFMSMSLRKNFRAVKKVGIPITPPKLMILTICPLWIVEIALHFLYKSNLGKTVINGHAQIAKEEIQMLDREFNALLG